MKLDCPPQIDVSEQALRLPGRVGDALKSKPPNYVAACEAQKEIASRAQQRRIAIDSCMQRPAHSDMRKVAAETLHEEAVEHRRQVEICAHVK